MYWVWFDSFIVIGLETQHQPFKFHFLSVQFVFVVFRSVSFCFVMQDFANGNFLAVQWRTETATGVLADCYGEVR